MNALDDTLARENERLRAHTRAEASFVGRAALATPDHDLGSLLGSIACGWGNALGVCSTTEAHRWDPVCENAVAVAADVLGEDPPAYELTEVEQRLETTP